VLKTQKDKTVTVQLVAQIWDIDYFLPNAAFTIYMYCRCCPSAEI